MTLLLIQGLRHEYEALDKVFDAAWDDDTLTAEDVENAYSALDSIIEKLILSSTSYKGLTSAEEITRNSALDMQYVTGALSEPEMRQREEWHRQRQERQDAGIVAN